MAEVLKKEDYNKLKKVADANPNFSLEELVHVYGKESSLGQI